MRDVISSLLFYFITDDNAPELSPEAQTRVAVAGGATMVQYRNKAYAETGSKAALDEAGRILDICRKAGVPMLINDHLELAEAVGADGVHVGQDDIPPAEARRRLGDDAIIGVSVSNMEELARTDLVPCDYIGTGPFFATGTKPDASAVLGAEGFREIVGKSPLPVVAIGGIGPENAHLCFQSGAAGVAVISCVSRAANPEAAARRLADVCRQFANPG